MPIRLFVQCNLLLLASVFGMTLPAWAQGVLEGEVAVSSLATTYAVDSEDEDATNAALEAKVAALWSLPTALAFLAWFVFAPQCISTIAVARRETNGWKWPLFMVAYLFGLAYLFAGLTYWGAVALGL